jgi:hypothetical protein
LLNLLPTSEKLFNELSQLQIDDWDQLIDAKSTFKLIYSLQIVESLLSLPTEVTPTTDSVRNFYLFTKYIRDLLIGHRSL